MLTALAWLGRHATWWIAGGVFLGLLVPPLAALLRPWLIPAIVLPFLVALLRLDLNALHGELAAPLLPALAVGWVLLGAPLLVAVIVRSLAPPAPFDAALVTTAACAPLMATGALALLLGLDIGLAVLVTVAATALVPLTLPPLALGLVGLEVALRPLELTFRLLILVVPSFIAAALLRRALGVARLAAMAEALNGLAVLGLVAFAIGIMDGVAAQMAARPSFVLACLGLSTLLNVGLQVTGAARFVAGGRSRALTIGLVSGNNNLGLVIAATADRAPEPLLVWVAMAQFRIYLLPVVQRRLYRGWLRATEEGR
jgi:BASS family bile acid:Na+ symporter